MLNLEKLRSMCVEHAETDLGDPVVSHNRPGRGGFCVRSAFETGLDIASPIPLHCKYESVPSDWFSADRCPCRLKSDFLSTIIGCGR